MKLILGGTGYIGCEIVKILESKSKPLRILGRRKDVHLSKELAANEYHIGSYTEKISIKLALKNIDCVYHLIHLFEEEEKFSSNNINKNLRYFKKFLTEAKKNEIKKIIYFSSAAVYGEKKNYRNVKENSDLNPINNYGITKLKMEKIFVNFCKKNSIKYLVIRPSSIFGKNADKNLGKNILYKLIHCLKNDEVFQIFGDGNSVRDYLHVNDLAKMTVQLDESNCIGKYNLGGYPFSINQIISLIEKKFNYRLNVKYDDRKENEVFKLVLDSTKTFNTLKKNIFDLKKLESEIEDIK